MGEVVLCFETDDDWQEEGHQGVEHLPQQILLNTCKLGKVDVK